MFPLLISRYVGTQYSLATVLIVVSILTAFGYPITSQGQLIHIHSPTNGIDIFAFIDAACSRSVSLGVFIAIFALMIIDIMLPVKEAASLFIFGVIGTSAQNILRLLVLILAGYYYGSEALWTAHTYAGYVIFQYGMLSLPMFTCERCFNCYKTLLSQPRCSSRPNMPVPDWGKDPSHSPDLHILFGHQRWQKLSPAASSLCPGCYIR